MSKKKQQEFLKIEGMSCANCALGIKKYLEKNGVQNVNVSFASSEASFTKTQQHTFDNVKALVQAMGYGVKKRIDNKKYSPDLTKNYVIADMITGYGVAESVKHYYNIWGGDLTKKKVVIQGWGNVASSAAYYLSYTNQR